MTSNFSSSSWWGKFKLMHLWGYFLSRSSWPCQGKNYYSERSYFSWLQSALVLLWESPLPSYSQWLHFQSITGSPSFLSSISRLWLLTCWVPWLSTSLSESLILSLTSVPTQSCLTLHVVSIHGFHPTPPSSVNYRDNIKYTRLSVSFLIYLRNSFIFFPLNSYSYGHITELIRNCNTS